MNIAAAVPESSLLESVACYYCGSEGEKFLTHAQDDLTGKPGQFRFVTCENCGLSYQNPRVSIDRIGEFYDDEYIAHRKKTDWGLLTPLYEWAMGKHDREKTRLVDKYISINASSQVLDVGCGAGTFLARLRSLYGVQAAGVDFKDLTHLPGFDQVEFHHGLFCEQKLEEERFDLITMWHFLEHDYDPLLTLAHAKSLLHPEGRLVVEVPRLDSVSFALFRERWPGLQAPQHTVLFTEGHITEICTTRRTGSGGLSPLRGVSIVLLFFLRCCFQVSQGKRVESFKSDCSLFYRTAVDQSLVPV